VYVVLSGTSSIPLKSVKQLGGCRFITGALQTTAGDVAKKVICLHGLAIHLCCDGVAIREAQAMLL
jgi:hypothetical protein